MPKGKDTSAHPGRQVHRDRFTEPEDWATDDAYWDSPEGKQHMFSDPRGRAINVKGRPAGKVQR